MSKLPTAEEALRKHINNGDPHNQPFDEMYIGETTAMIAAIESHTAAHTAGLRERVTDLEAKIASYESAIDGLKKVVDSLYKLKS